MDKKPGKRPYRGRCERDALRWSRKLERHRVLHNRIRNAAPDIFGSDNFERTKSHIQHGNMTVNAHCQNVAKYSLIIRDKLHIKCSEKELIRGALLHDYFLYDWHTTKPESIFKLHGFNHPTIALENAAKEYELTPREQEIIKKHMWPLTVVPPTCREAWIVTMADKWCSLLETIHVHKGHGAKISSGLGTAGPGTAHTVPEGGANVLV